MFIKIIFYIVTGNQFTNNHEIMQVLTHDHPIYFLELIDYPSAMQHRFFQTLLTACKIFPRVLQILELNEESGMIIPGDAFIVPSSAYGGWVPAIFYRPRLPLYMRFIRGRQQRLHLPSHLDCVQLFGDIMKRATILAHQVITLHPESMRSEDGDIIMMTQGAIRDWIPALVYRPTIPAHSFVTNQYASQMPKGVYFFPMYNQ